MPLLMVAYLLLAMNVTVRAGGAISGRHGSFFAEVGAAGLMLRIDGTLDLKRRMMRLYGGREIRLNIRRRRNPSILRLVRAGRFESAFMHVRIGCNDAAQTAVAAGALRSAALSVSAVLGASTVVHIEPDYGAACFFAAGQGIYSFQPGDIILAAAKAAWNRKRREGFTWKSIPLKA